MNVVSNSIPPVSLQGQIDINSTVPLTPQEQDVVDDLKSIYQIMQEIQAAGGSDISVPEARQLCVYIQKLFTDCKAFPAPISPDDQSLIDNAEAFFTGSYSPCNLEQAAENYNPLDPNNVQSMQDAMKTFISSGWMNEDLPVMQQLINNPI